MSKSELTSEKYSNTDKYKYIFDYTSVSYGYHSNNSAIYGQSANYGGVKNATGQVRRFSIADRTDNKQYVMNMTSGFWSKLQRMYFQNMESVRAKNNSERMTK